jgi:hypothetical protein
VKGDVPRAIGAEAGSRTVGTQRICLGANNACFAVVKKESAARGEAPSIAGDTWNIFAQGPRRQAAATLNRAKGPKIACAIPLRRQKSI